MKKIFVLISLTTLFFACVVEEPNIITNYNITNISGHKITIVPEFPLVGSNFNFDSVIFHNNENYEIQYSEPGGYFGIPLDDVRLLKIYFNDTILVVNYRDSASFFPSGNIQKLSDWRGGKIKDYYFKFEFSFTEADFLEALKQ